MTDESGRGDPTRTLELLWGTREPPSRGPKPGLTVEQIVRTAIELADAEGVEALSMRRLAAELGVGTMSLYRYVPGKAELVDLMLDAVHGEGDPPGAGVTGWRALLEHHAREGWAMYQRHPWAVTAYSRPVLGPNVIDGYEALLAALADSGLAPGDIVNAAELVGHYVGGAARRAAEEAEVARRTGVSDDQWWSARESFWERYFDVERYPTISAMWDSDAFEARADAFEFGLQRVLDGIEAYLATAARRTM
jgi:AcrR family transcriptional regulator